MQIFNFFYQWQLIESLELHLERLILAKLFFFNKNDFVKINQNPPPFTLFPSPDFQERGKGGIRRGGALANFSSEERPRFIDALIATILYNPFSVKCSWRYISLNASLNNRKPDHLSVINGYLSKWSIITLKSFIEVALNRIDFSLI